MHFDGNVVIQAPQEKAWKFLTDPDSVSQCVPGLKSVEVVVPNEKFRAVASVGFGTVSTTFSNDIEFVELEPPNRALIKLHGTAAGSAVDVLSEMVLSDVGDGSTTLTWSADINIVGTIASLASRMMGGVTKKLTKVFFTCVKEKIEN